MSRTAPSSDDLASDALDALVSDLVATRAMMSALQAHEATVMAGVMAVADAAAVVRDRSEADLQHRSVAAEVAAALRVSDRTVQRQLADAALLTERFPATHAALRAGLISRAHVSVIMDAGRHLADPDDLARYEAMILPYAQTVTAGRLRPVARLRVERVLPSSLQDRHDRAVALRGVRVIDGDDGTADLHAFGLKAAIAHGIHDRLTALAHRIERGGPTRNGRDDALDDRVRGGEGDGELVPDARTMDQLRADILADLALATDPVAHRIPTGLAAIRASVQVTVPVLTLLPGSEGARTTRAVTAVAATAVPDGTSAAGHCPTGADFGPADLAGYGPIDPDTARHLAGHAPGWDRILTHPISGAILAVGRYRPSKAIARALRARDRHCRFVGCRQPVHRCDLDHTRDAHAGGRTAVCNLANLCRRHHILKHHTAWQVRQLPGGILEWTSPTGRVYTDVPVSTVAFAPTPEPDSSPDPPPF
ncbi:HNH endonuclease signature motif containing protein [Microbacterium sp.]|uniref:HNH endonuclease signature motif containing protein n=2 Tax=Microbacterium TaxID=33882 RepID=UPI00092CB96F|nr:HNH endonuclease signature motif containing protein [Microbacterium sp.]MBN9193375.1 DUF222 domain-containing protein [Microbacterium sp.]OJU71270.1 MAG: hypothetical protein BGO04_12015 [Microbacterium sp. 70-38]